MIRVYTDRLVLGDFSCRCAIGTGGFTREKREGDGCTPVGMFPLRQGFYRNDLLSTPSDTFPLRPLTPEDGWCDDPADPLYNRHVTLPYPASHERLWREDHVYDIIIPIGYNDEPIVAGRGSAIFLHLAKENYTPTEGCVAIALPDMLTILASITKGSTIALIAS